MSDLMFWIGVVTCTLIGVALLWLIGEIAWGFVCAVSLMRWTIRVAILNGRFRKLRWRNLPASFFSDWSDCIGYRNDGSRTVTATESGSQWHGVGDYTLFRAEESHNG